MYIASEKNGKRGVNFPNIRHSQLRGGHTTYEGMIYARVPTGFILEVTLNDL